MPSLAPYRKKRRFDRTREPRGVVRAGVAHAPIFVVQAHAARRMHYDLRLELDGTLKSWAVPKGPSNDPSEKRLAVEVEDHPVAYASFEGVIPKGEYGAGHVEIWDEGTWRPIGDAKKGLAAGKLEFELDGKRLRGRWKLVRMAPRAAGKAPPQWLLIKARETREPLVRAPRVDLPPTLRPMLATWVALPPPGDAFLYEVKLDGYRMLTRIEGGRARLSTRNGLDFTGRLPEHARAIESLGLGDSVFDGEIVVFDEDGASRFEALQDALASTHERASVRYVVFDMPFREGRDLRELPVEQRRASLDAVMRANTSSLLARSESIEGDVAALVRAARALGAEGLIGKRRGSTYVSGRSTAWIKLTFTERQDVVVVGYTTPRGARSGFGALVVGVYDGAKLTYAGRVGTGFRASALDELHALLSASRVTKAPIVTTPVDARGVTWVKPTHVAEVSHSGFTARGVLRKGVFVAMRPDKSPREAVRARPAPRPEPPRSRARAQVAQDRTRFAGVDLSSADRVIDPSTGLTKGDLAAYYEAISPRLLPHLAHRPVALVRAPDGIDASTFFQKHAKGRAIHGVRRMADDLDPGHPPLLAIDTSSALLGAVQMNTIELHTWNAHEQDIERPDRMIFDLDPDPELAFARVSQAAVLVRELLDALGLRAFLKTTGGKGLHVVVPLVPEASWDDVKAFSKAVASHFARVLPEHFVSKSGAKNREGRIFIDYLRNGRGASTVAALSARARPGLPVSVPIRWEALRTLARPEDLDIRTAPTFIARQRVDPWKDYGTTRQMITDAMRAQLGA